MTNDEKNRLLQRAAEDPEFRLRLLRNPAGTAAELGIVLSEEESAGFIAVAEAILSQNLPEQIEVMGVIPVFRTLPPGQ